MKRLYKSPDAEICLQDMEIATDVLSLSVEDKENGNGAHLSFPSDDQVE